MTKKIILTVAVFVLLISGCTTINRITDFTVISTKNIDLSRMGEYSRGKERVTGEDKVMIIIFPIGSIPTVKEAIDIAVESVPGCVGLVDGVVYSKRFSFLIGAEFSYIAEGTPLIDPNLVEADFPPRLILSYNYSTGKYEAKAASLDEINNLFSEYDYNIE